LLDPCADCWGDHFELVNDEMIPRDGDGNAAFTSDAYDLLDPRKTRSRFERRQAVDEAWRVVRAVPGLVEQLERRAVEQGDEDGSLFKAIRELLAAYGGAERQLQHFVPVPLDSRECECECFGASATLPAFLVEQLVEWNATYSGSGPTV
jgi:hypothetical protein